MKPVTCLRTDAAEMTVTSGPVVEHVNVIEGNRPVPDPGFGVHFLIRSVFSELNNNSAPALTLLRQWPQIRTTGQYTDRSANPSTGQSDPVLDVE